MRKARIINMQGVLPLEVPCSWALSRQPISCCSAKLGSSRRVELSYPHLHPCLASGQCCPDCSLKNKCFKFGILISEMNDQVLALVQTLLPRCDLTRLISFLAQKPPLKFARNVRQPFVQADTVLIGISVWLARTPVLWCIERGLSAGPPLKFALNFLISQTNPNVVTGFTQTCQPSD